MSESLQTEISAMLDKLDAADPASVKAIYNVVSERLRHIEVEGWTPAHDDRHPDGSLSQAAAAYAEHAGKSEGRRALYPAGEPPSAWPWEARWWKPKSPIYELRKAGALTIADMARMFRVTGAAN
jgi:hypothetical protein